jgi:hypothetical protein
VRFVIAVRPFSAALAMRLDDGLTSSQINGERRAKRRAKTTDLAAAMAKKPARRAWFRALAAAENQGRK